MAAVVKFLGAYCDDVRRIADAAEDIAETLHERLGDGRER
jgi:hypothetical protein